MKPNSCRQPALTSIWYSWPLPVGSSSYLLSEHDQGRQPALLVRVLDPVVVGSSVLVISSNPTAVATRLYNSPVLNKIQDLREKFNTWNKARSWVPRLTNVRKPSKPLKPSLRTLASKQSQGWQLCASTRVRILSSSSRPTPLSNTSAAENQKKDLEACSELS